MDDDAVLDIDLVADANAVDIAADDGVEPDAAFVAYLYVADDGGIGGDETVVSKFGEFTFDGEDGGHRSAFSLCKYPKIFHIYWQVITAFSFFCSLELVSSISIRIDEKLMQRIN